MAASPRWTAWRMGPQLLARFAATWTAAAAAAAAGGSAGHGAGKSCQEDTSSEHLAFLQCLQPKALQTTAAQRSIGGESACDVRARWLGAAGGGGVSGSAGAVPPMRDWPVSCTSVKRVCFVQDEIVSLGRENETDSYWHVPDTAGLGWFSKQAVFFNLPGYFDGLRGVQSAARPLRARPLAGSLEPEPLASAPLLNVTPVVVFPTWPFNFGDTMGQNFMHTWVQWTAEHPAVRSMPLAVALPHKLLLPPFWRLAEGLGTRVESFSRLSLPCPSRPLCFKEVIGCSGFDVGPWHRHVAADGGRAWESFRSTVVSAGCPGAAATGSARRRSSGPLVVAFTQRSRNRRLLNLESLMAACHEAGQLAGRPLRCRTLQLSDIRRDLCGLQDVDVLVGIHGAQLANALFMRPGTSLLEVRPHDWWATGNDGKLRNPDAWSSTVAQKVWLTNRTRYFFYGALANESFPDERSKVPGRDSDVDVSWPLLRCMLERIASPHGREDPSTEVNAGCSRGSA